MSEHGSCPAWLEADWRALMARHRAGRMPHALLICGSPGIGKRQFTRSLIAALLCRDAGGGGPACEHCDACVQLLAGSHPDFRKVVPEGAGNTVRIEPVRALSAWLSLAARPGSYKLALIESADAMNSSAANSLLKTLEEPPSAALLILLADRPAQLPATVRSRCQRVQLGLSDTAAALHWLARQVEGDDPCGRAKSLLSEAGGAPLKALALLDDTEVSKRTHLLKAWEDLFLHRASIGRISALLADLPLAACLEHFAKLTYCVARTRAGVPLAGDPATLSVVSRTQDCLPNDEWFTLYRQILYLYRIDSASFKTRAVLEGLMADIRARIER